MYDKFGNETSRTIVDSDLVQELQKYKWHFNDSNGVTTKDKDGNRIHMTSIIMDIIPNGNSIVIDHINGNRLDNRRCNLRICNQNKNVKNQKKKITNTSGYKGVSLVKKTGKYIARITVNYENVYLGTYSDKVDAARAYNNAALKYFGEFSRINIIKDDDEK